jgi:hypothetical protein
MVLATPSPLMPLPPRTSQHSQSLVTSETRQSQDTVAEPSLLVAVASVEVRLVPGVDEPSFREAAPVPLADRATTEVADPTLAVAVAALAGRIMTSLLVTATPVSMSRLSGSFLRRSTSTAWLS